MSVALKIEGSSHGPSHSPTISRVPSEVQEMEENTELDIESSPTPSALQNFIPRVPPKFREMGENKGCYDPMVVSIGPYHHGDKKLEKMEKFKAVFVHRFADQLEASQMHQNVANLVSRARECYTEESTNRFNDEDFTRMMFLDGFFIMHFLSSKPEDLTMTSEDAALVTRDLFLLENQIPMEILISLMSFRFKNDNQWKDLFSRFFKHIRAMPPQREHSSWERISNTFVIRKFSKRVSSQFRQNFDGHLLGLFHLIFVRDRKGVVSGSPTRWYQRETSWKWYYPVKQLKKVGINLKPSKTSLFTDIRLQPTLLSATLHVPPLRIDDFTKPLLLNLVAYEDCLGPASPQLFTSYICFMRSLIVSPKDVKTLRTKGILFTTIESLDDHVVQLFKEMATNLVDNPDAFIRVKNAIKSHFRSSFWQWILYYKGPVSTAVVKYSFLYGFVVSAIQAYVSATQQKPGFGNCSCPNATQLHH